MAVVSVGRYLITIEPSHDRSLCMLGKNWRWGLGQFSGCADGHVGDDGGDYHFLYIKVRELDNVMKRLTEERNL